MVVDARICPGCTKPATEWDAARNRCRNCVLKYYSDYNRVRRPMVTPPPKQTFPLSRLRQQIRTMLELDPTLDYAVEAELSGGRPKTRGECVDGPRPCPWVGCRHHLYLEVNERTGSITINFPEIGVENMGESCALDVADRGPLNLAEIGRIVRRTRERVRQIDIKGQLLLQAALNHTIEED